MHLYSGQSTSQRHKGILNRNVKHTDTHGLIHTKRDGIYLYHACKVHILAQQPRGNALIRYVLFFV